VFWRDTVTVAVAAVAAGFVALMPAAPPGTGRALASCEQKIEQNMERARRGAGLSIPGLAVVGASFTAGVGPGDPDRSWAVRLAGLLHWDAVIIGVPGAGYVRAGAGRRGPVADEIAQAGLRRLAPSLVIVQAGHDDIGVPLRLERRRVDQVISVIRAQAPRARIALLTVFTRHSSRPAAKRTDQAIVTAATAADREVIIMDPLAAGWRFGHSRDGLHPTAGGDEWIAREVAGILREHGMRAVPPSRHATSAAGPGAPVICYSGGRGRPVATGISH
jgi:acyl-CoA thioesterase I